MIRKPQPPYPMLSKKYNDLVRRLVRRIRNAELKIRNLEQIREAFGDDNRLYASLDLHIPLGEVTEAKAYKHYDEHGGTDGYRQRRRMLHRRSA